MVIMLGIIEFGLASNAQITITNAAREGARTMAIKNSTVAAIASVKAAAPNASVTILSSQISITPAVCTAGQVTKVQVTYPYKFLTGFFGTGYTMTGMAAMRCGG
ncbi:MAG: pilus assembly protein [Candidatus Saccharibacteria bacterium]|nr:pilus assembly protein [Microbacteriaceae bacterium]